MTGTVVVAWLHYVSILLLTGSLVAEHLLFKSPYSLEQLRRLLRLDAVYGLSALAVLLTGGLLMHYSKGTAYYLQHGAFHAKLTLFVLAALLSLYPTWVLLRWRRPLRAGQLPAQGAEYGRIRLILRAQLVLLLLIPLFAAWMARGT